MPADGTDRTRVVMRVGDGLPVLFEAGDGWSDRARLIEAVERWLVLELRNLDRRRVKNRR